MVKSDMIEKKQFDALDLTKWISSLFVIVIHTAPLTDYEIANYYITNVLARLAVPLFFAISGYLFFRKITFENGRIARTKENIKRLTSYVKHLGIIYLISSGLYLLYRIPYWYSINWWGVSALKDYIVSFFLSGSEYHLWYILASLYGIIILYALLSFASFGVVKYLCVIGWIFECLIYSYSWIGIDKINILTWLTSNFSVCFDAAFRAVPLMFAGAVVNFRLSSKFNISSIIVALFALITESSLLYFVSPNNTNYSYILMTLPVAYLLLQGLLSLNIKFKNRIVAKWMRKTSLIIYIVHPMIIYLLNIAGLTQGMLLWLTVTIISVLLSTAVVELQHHRTNLE